MGAYIKSIFFRQSLLAFTGLPLLLWAMGDFPERTLLKESLSVLTILAFCRMIGQFFWTRTGRYTAVDLNMSRVVTYHKFVGYIFTSVLLLHPFLLVVPRFFEGGVAPGEAFLAIITTFTNRGVLLGIIAWGLLLAIVITAFARKKLPMAYTTWRMVHGMLAICFISIAAWHVIGLGRHSTLSMSIFIGILTTAGVLLLLKVYTLKILKTKGKYK